MHRGLDTVTHMFEVVDVSEWSVDEIDEQLGTKEKCWMRERQWLFKQVREGRAGVSGEDWAEKVVEQLGVLLGLPVAEVQLAVRHQRRGIISKTFVDAEGRLEHGNELLVRVDRDYDRDLARHNERYTVPAVKAALAGVGPPSGYEQLAALDAFDVWSGYLVLDAWVAGRDRHHENWGVIAKGHVRELAPSFDHGNALGFQEPLEAQERMLEDQEALGTWARRGRSHHFAGKPRLTDLANQALTLASTEAANLWRQQLALVHDDDCAAVLEQVPAALMSVPARMFCLEMLKTNRRRLTDGD